MFNIPDKINMFNVYQSGKELVGVTNEVALPEINELTSEMSGPGILGSIDSPTKGMFENFEFELGFRTLYKTIFELMVLGGATDLTLRGSIQVTDREGFRKEVGMRVVVRGSVKGINPGTVKQGEGTGASAKLTLTYYFIEIGGLPMIEIDKLNAIYKVRGIDQLAVTKALC